MTYIVIYLYLYIYCGELCFEPASGFSIFLINETHGHGRHENMSITPHYPSHEITSVKSSSFNLRFPS